MKDNITHAKSLGPCDLGCDCVPPANSYDYRTHSNVSCCKIDPSIKLPNGTPANCDGKKLPTGDHDRGKDYNHSSKFTGTISNFACGPRACCDSLLVLTAFLDLIIEGLIGIRAALSNLLVIHPLA